jgi:NAD-dependent dihydropyrimidine dehydrogenase PreA subunit
MSKMKYLKDVTTLKLDQDKCTGCTLCTLVCPHGVFVMQDGKAQLTDRDRCMECGACARNCAFEAISVAAGVGCASAIIYGWLTGKEASCDCGGGC